MAVVREEVKLLGSSMSLVTSRVRIALNLKGVEYDFFEEREGQESNLLLESSPVYNRFPVLIHNGKPVCGSMIIVEYIDEMWTSSGSSILPADSYDCAIARFWTAYVDGKFPSLCRILIGFQEGDKEHALEQLVASLHLLEEAFVKCSKGKSFFGGDDIGYLDIALGSHFGWIRPTEKVTGIQLLEKEKFPHLLEWFEYYRSHHAVKEVTPTTDELLTVVEEVKSSLDAPAK
ncbi:hypothetical protein LUZ62_056162 [Rhynchospora pubera]|uniref:Glutathione S-transferase n=1 Tax=Rhynchospora pubera TaxID=906938 RepID=A0AAV8DRR0_9POAL|nr:hypothetical protein LUZ62_056162 [Rhynchospora pubera]